MTPVNRGLAAGMYVVPLFLLAVGTFVPGIPYLGTAATSVFPAVPGPMLVGALVGTLLGVWVVRSGATRLGGVLGILSVLTAAGAITIIALHARVARDNGVAVNLLATVSPWGAGMGASPDQSAVYTTMDGTDLSLDIYRPAGHGEGLAPVAVYVHGGGWSSGHRRSKAANLRWLADHGYVGVGLDYMLATADRATWNSAAPQIACGLAWIAANATTHGGDAARIFLLGESAGGALALTAGYAAAAGLSTSSCGGHVPAVRAVAANVPAVDPVTLYQNRDPILGRFSRKMVRWYLGGAPFEHPDRALAVSTITYVTPKAPPTMLLLNDEDNLVPLDGTLQFIERVKQAGVELRIVRFPLADHGAGVPYYSVINQAWLQMLRQHFCRHGGDCT